MGNENVDDCSSANRLVFQWMAEDLGSPTVEDQLGRLRGFHLTGDAERDSFAFLADQGYERVLVETLSDHRSAVEAGHQVYTVLTAELCEGSWLPEDDSARIVVIAQKHILGRILESAMGSSTRRAR